MLSLTSVLSLAALLVPALAAPQTLLGRQEGGQCPSAEFPTEYLETDWCSTDPDASIVMLLRDEKVSYGTLNPGDIMQSVRDHCNGAICDQNWTLDTMWVRDTQVTRGVLRVKVIDAVMTPANVEHITSAQQWVLDRTTDWREEMYLQPVPCSGSVCPQPTEHTVNQGQGPSGISMQFRETGVAKPIHERMTGNVLTLVFEPEASESTFGTCGTLMGLGVGAASLINGAFGAVASFAMLGCDAWQIW